MAHGTEKFNRIKGGQLSDYVDKPVIFLGQIKQISPDGKAIEMETTDKVIVRVTFAEPTTAAAEDYVEVYGTVLTGLTVASKSHTIFPPEISEGFESENYDALLTVLHAIGGKKWKVNDDADED